MKKYNAAASDALYAEYDWFKKLFPLAMQKSSDGFFMPGLKCEMIGLSKNINMLQSKKSHFVTKVRIDKFYDMFLRIEEPTVALLLNKGLGKSNRGFNINKLTDLEGEVLTQFNDYVYKIIVQFLEPPPVVNFTRTNFDMTHITFLIKDEEEEEACGRFIISVPDGRLKPNKIVSKEDKFEYRDFYKCTIPVKITLGNTRLSVKALKELEAEDLIILENSTLDRWKLHLNDFEKDILLEPNHNLDLDMDNDDNGGDEMGNTNESANLWDSIEVDMYAELNPVKISLGDLKRIEEGLVVDVAALYDNKVTLRVENKVVGHGELVIINDRYGVKISDIAEGGEPEMQEDPFENQQQQLGPQPPEMEMDNEDGEEFEQAQQEQFQQEGNGEGEEEFDYSDFELEDEDI